MFIGEARRNATADSHNRLFGEVDRSYPVKSHSRSNIPIGSDSIDSSAVVTNGKANGHGLTNGNGHVGNGHTNGNGNVAKPQNGEAATLNGNGLKNGTY